MKGLIILALCVAFTTAHESKYRWTFEHGGEMPKEEPKPPPKNGGSGGAGGGGGGGGNGGGSSADKRVYSFAFTADNEHDYRPYEFLSLQGELMGFSIDIVREVCSKAEKECAFVTFNNHSLCWTDDVMYSFALNNRFWDVCVGWDETPERRLTYKFLGEFANETPNYFYVLSTSSIDKADIETHKIGVHHDMKHNEWCLKRNNLLPKNLIYFEDLDEMKEQLESGKIDVAFLTENEARDKDYVKKISDNIPCAKKGPSLMMRKDMYDDLKWFDDVLNEKVIPSYYYKWACNVAENGYKGNPYCKL